MMQMLLGCSTVAGGSTTYSLGDYSATDFVLSPGGASLTATINFNNDGTVTGTGLTSSNYVTPGSAAADQELRVEGAAYFSAITAQSANTTSGSVTWPSGGVAAGDTLVIITAAKYDNAVATPSGFTERNNFKTTIGTTGVDTGDVRIQSFTKIAAGTETSTALSKTTETGTIFVARGIVIKHPHGSSVTVEFEAGNGEDLDGGTAYSVTSDASMSTRMGDIILCFTGLNTDSGTYSNHALTQTGATFLANSSTIGEAEIADAGTSQGDDVRLVAALWLCSDGSSTAAPSYSTTISAAGPEGATGFLKIRVISPWLDLATTRSYSVSIPDLGSKSAAAFLRIRDSASLTEQDTGTFYLEATQEFSG